MGVTDIDKPYVAILYVPPISVALIQGQPPGHFTHIPITTLVVSALKNYYT
jgi:hypothetical protein